MNTEPTMNPEAEPESTSHIGRRSFLIGAAAVGLLASSPASVLAATAKKTAGKAKPKTPAKISGTIALQSNNADDKSKKGMEALVAAFNAKKTGTVKLNTVAGELYRTQLTQYLTSSKPPEVLTWLAGKAAQNYADQGLLLDISDVWASPEMAGYSSALKGLSTATDGKQIFVPIYYYWCGVYYRPSKFAEWGVKPPKTWDEYKALCKTLLDKGVTPIGMGLSDTPWVASFWFDYLNLRVNGAKFHRDVLSGKKSFNSPEVKAVFAKWSEMLPYMDKQAKGLAFAEAQTKFYKGETATYVAGNWWALGAPKDVGDDIDFFQFPIIDPKVPVAEEAPADGFFASAKGSNPALTKAFMRFIATPAAQELYLTTAGNSSIPAAPGAKAAVTYQNTKGKAMLEAAADLTQFFNRDGGDELQPTADAALLKFMDKPGDVDAIIAEWQTAAVSARKA
jgi:multiple sugar transport system substrate-binding protein